MKAIVINIFLFCIVVTGCKVKSSIIIKSEKLDSTHIISRPGFIEPHAKLTSVTINDTTLYFWVAYDQGYEEEGNIHRFFIYDVKGKLVAAPHGILMDVDKYRNIYKYYVAYDKNPFRVKVDMKDYDFEPGLRKNYLISNGNKFQFVEYCLHDISPTDESRIPYYRQYEYRPSELPKHAILIESANKSDFIYSWKTVESRGDILEVTTYSMSGKARSLETYKLNNKVKNVNFDNYSLLFNYTEALFFNEGTVHKLKYLDYKRLDEK